MSANLMKRDDLCKLLLKKGKAFADCMLSMDDTHMVEIVKSSFIAQIKEFPKDYQWLVVVKDEDYGVSVSIFAAEQKKPEPVSEVKPVEPVVAPTLPLPVAATTNQSVTEAAMEGVRQQILANQPVSLM